MFVYTLVYDSKPFNYILEHSDVPWLITIKDKLLIRDDFNIIIVDWSNGAKAPYEQAAGNARMVGVQMAELIRFLVNSTNATTQSFYFVGSGLGAHAAGFAGKDVVRKLKETALGRITGMKQFKFTVSFVCEMTSSQT